MMVEARKDDDERPVADATADLSRFAQSSTRLFAEQAAVLAVMTAYGMSVAAQMTGMMLGSLRGPVDASDMPVPEQKTAAAEPKPMAEVVPLRPRAVAESVSVPSPEVSKSPKAAKTVKARTSPARPAASAPARRVATAAVEGTSPAAIGDDLKKISGIGPRMEQVLNKRGITRYADMAAMSKAALKKLDGELGLEGRTAKDDWAGQAKALSGGKG